MPTAGVSSAASSSPLAVAPRLSIVVLPFANLSNDPEQQYFADPITDDLTTDLSRIDGMLVISHNTAFTYQGKRLDTRQIGQELGAEAARPTDNPNALDYVFRGRAAMFKPGSPAKSAESITLFEPALSLDPSSTAAQSYLAIELAYRVLSVISEAREADIARATDLAEQAPARAPRSRLAHYAKATVRRAQRRHTEAIAEYETLVAADRNSVGAIFGRGWCKVFTGAIEEAIPAAVQAIRLSPRDPGISTWCHLIGRVHLLRLRADAAIRWLEADCNRQPANPNFRGYLAAAYALNDETARAAGELAKARKLSAKDRFASIARVKASIGKNYEVPSVRVLFEATYLAGLRKAGMPKE